MNKGEKGGRREKGRRGEEGRGRRDRGEGRKEEGERVVPYMADQLIDTWI